MDTLLGRANVSLPCGAYSKVRSYVVAVLYAVHTLITTSDLEDQSLGARLYKAKRIYRRPASLRVRSGTNGITQYMVGM